jgi:hypothetical protein
VAGRKFGRRRQFDAVSVLMVQVSWSHTTVMLLVWR